MRYSSFLEKLQTPKSEVIPIEKGFNPLVFVGVFVPVIIIIAGIVLYCKRRRANEPKVTFVAKPNASQHDRNFGNNAVQVSFIFRLVGWC